MPKVAAALGHLQPAKRRISCCNKLFQSFYPEWRDEANKDRLRFLPSLPFDAMTLHPSYKPIASYRNTPTETGTCNEFNTRFLVCFPGSGLYSADSAVRPDGWDGFTSSAEY
ncbi:hypothetical protein WN944_000412 [Citrus x changshan-huyou]|uniref:Uncharacterized protein n=1 Tax=Citrus x changshan-huyou TaxID=2935761 RepID=A0AAP0MEH4_9ROSI